MAGDTIITVVGNLTADPELRFTPSGAAVANVHASRPPRAPSTGRPTSGRTARRCSCAAHLASGGGERRRVAERGMRVIVSGRLKQRSYETKEGEKRTVIELEVDEIGPSLKYATAKVNRTQRGSAAVAAASAAGGSGGGGAAADDPWGSAPPARRRRGGLLRRAALLDPQSVPTGTTISSRTHRETYTWPSHRFASRRRRSEPVLQGRTISLHRLQGHHPAAQVHLRPRQDPRPPGDRHAPSTSARSPRPSRTPARWRCCRTPRPRADGRTTP